MTQRIENIANLSLFAVGAIISIVLSYVSFGSKQLNMDFYNEQPLGMFLAKFVLIFAIAYIICSLIIKAIKASYSDISVHRFRRRTRRVTFLTTLAVLVFKLITLHYV